MNIQSLFIISGPSGAGEDSIIDALAERLQVERVITSTTRDPRPGETHGNPYYFISRAKFSVLIDSDALAEWAEEYNGNLYGVTHDELVRVSSSGKIGLWKIEWKGVMKAKLMFPGIVAILISAPLASIEARIRRRDGLSEEYLAERMAYTREWMTHTDIYDYTIENRDGELDKAVDQAEAIIRRHLGFPERS
ncbi:MAG: guanylate kinase [Candidatus Moranbacteria bacterium]|nr:guanylate kinase [Candidatus Moranbacteria bacterium]NTW75456.1 guanylate kinase [Candidatus Moranbacteria bacterium]